MQKDVVLRFTDGEEFKGTLKTFMAPPDQVGFERHYGVGITKFEEEGRVEWVLWLIHKAYGREHPPAVEFEAFLANLAEFDLPDESEDDLIPPTRTPPPA